jgi:hypothetical protein
MIAVLHADCDGSRSRIHGRWQMSAAASFRSDSRCVPYHVSTVAFPANKASVTVAERPGLRAARRKMRIKESSAATDDSR